VGPRAGLDAVVERNLPSLQTVEPVSSSSLPRVKKAYNRKDSMKVTEYVRDESLQKQIIAAVVHVIRCLLHAKLVAQQ
jgi:hypothetical protein